MSTNEHKKKGFRNDINGLRAWAVVFVILYHFNFSAFSGGFVGVDVFFVISGFLMTGIVFNGLERSEFSLLIFYWARMRRIIPALLVMCAVLLTVGWFILLPADLKAVSAHSIYAVGFLSNIKFWQEAGYFDSASHEKWLLHTWSLSVEWQFYLVLPILMWMVWKLKPGWGTQLFTLCCAFIFSFLICVFSTVSQPTMAFYFLHTRAWEMLSGGIVYLLAIKYHPSKIQSSIIEYSGLAAVTFSVFAFDNSMAWPSWHPLIPAIGAALVIIANGQSPWTASLLAQWIGGRSYSLYLWHWPVYVTLAYWNLDSNPYAVLFGLIATLLLGQISYLYVENTSRQYLEARQLPYSVGLLIITIVLFLASAFAIWKANGINGRFAPTIELAAAEAANFNPRRDECHPNKGTKSPSCVYGGTEWKVIAVGDSHINAMVTAMAAAKHGGDAGVVQWSYSGCPFVPGIIPMPERLAAMGGSTFQCTEFLNWVNKEITLLPSSIPVIIAARYAEAAYGANESLHDTSKPEVYFSRMYISATPEFLSEFSEQITNSACTLAKQRDVYLVRPIPEMGVDVPKTLSRNMILGISSDVTITMESYWRRNSWVWTAQNKARDKCGVQILDPTAYLCKENLCYGSIDGRPLYIDDDHLSEFGNKILTPMFAKVFYDLEISTNKKH